MKNDNLQKDIADAKGDIKALKKLGAKYKNPDGSLPLSLRWAMDSASISDELNENIIRPDNPFPQN
jgi:hypothetical protein